MAEELNRHFSNVFITEDNSSIPATEPWARCPPIITTLSVTKRQVLAKIGKMVAHSSPGPDGITPRLLKELAREIAGPLSKIFQKSLQEGVVPADWKFANVTPKHKKGCMDNPDNYRPISTSSVVGKLFESIVKDAITAHLLNNYLIWNTQHSFIPQKQNTNRKDFITSVTEQGKSVDIVCLDFLKAFDKIPQENLLAKIAAKGIHGQLLAWIGDWLTGSQQRVKVNERYSSWSPVTSGITQGSVLGPILFVIYMDDLDLAIARTTKVWKFADDIKLAQEVSSIRGRQQLQTSLDNVATWASTWGMNINRAKCKVDPHGQN